MTDRMISRSDFRNIIKELQPLLHFTGDHSLASWRSFGEAGLQGFLQKKEEVLVSTSDLQQFLWELIFDHSLDQNAAFVWEPDPDPNYRDQPNSLEPVDSRDEAWAKALEWIVKPQQADR